MLDSSSIWWKREKKNEVLANKKPPPTRMRCAAQTGLPTRRANADTDGSKERLDLGAVGMERSDANRGDDVEVVVVLVQIGNKFFWDDVCRQGRGGGGDERLSSLMILVSLDPKSRPRTEEIPGSGVVQRGSRCCVGGLEMSRVAWVSWKSKEEMKNKFEIRMTIKRRRSSRREE